MNMEEKEIELSVRTSRPAASPKDGGEDGLVSPTRKKSYRSRIRLSSPKSLRQLKATLQSFGTAGFVGHRNKSFSEFVNVSMSLTKDAKKQKRRMKENYLLVPGSSLFKIWNIIVFLCLLYTFICTPLQTAFLMQDMSVSAPSKWTGLFAIDRVVDVVFILDVVLSFRTVQKDASKRYWYDARVIAKKKFESFSFYFDLMACLPIDIIVGLSTTSGRYSAERVIRLLKALRVYRFREIMLLLESTMVNRSSWFESFNILFAFVVWIHWVCCGWIMMSYTIDNVEDRWTYQYADGDSSELYGIGIYWTLMTLTTVGFGDVTPRLGNNGEMYYNAFMFICGAVTYSLVMSKIIAWSNDRTKIEFENTLSDLSSVMHELQFNDDLKKRIWRYCNYIKETSLLGKKADAFSILSASLRKEAAVAAYFSAIEHIPLINFLIESKQSVKIMPLVTSVATILRIELYGPNEVLCELNDDEGCDQLFMIRDGTVLVETKMGEVQLLSGYNNMAWRKSHDPKPPSPKKVNRKERRKTFRHKGSVRRRTRDGLRHEFTLGICNVVFRETSYRRLAVTQSFSNILSLSKKEMFDRVWSRFQNAHQLAKGYCARLRLREIVRSTDMANALKRLQGKFGLAVGVHVMIVKSGSTFFGATAVVLDMNWSGSGRIKVRMTDDGAIKSYTHDQLQCIGEVDATPSASKVADTKKKPSDNRAESKTSSSKIVDNFSILKILSEQSKAIERLNDRVSELKQAILRKE